MSTDPPVCRRINAYPYAGGLDTLENVEHHPVFEAIYANLLLSSPHDAAFPHTLTTTDHYTIPKPKPKHNSHRRASRLPLPLHPWSLVLRLPLRRPKASPADRCADPWHDAGCSIDRTPVQCARHDVCMRNVAVSHCDGAPSSSCFLRVLPSWVLLCVFLTYSRTR